MKYIEDMTNEQIKKWVEIRKERKITQQVMAEITGVSRSHIANFENLRVNNMYLFNYYQKLFD